MKRLNSGRGPFCASLQIKQILSPGEWDNSVCK